MFFLFVACENARVLRKGTLCCHFLESFMSKMADTGLSSSWCHVLFVGSMSTRRFEAHASIAEDFVYLPRNRTFRTGKL